MTNPTSVAITTPQPLSPTARHYTVTLKSECASKTKHNRNVQNTFKGCFYVFKKKSSVKHGNCCDHNITFNFLGYGLK